MTNPLYNPSRNASARIISLVPSQTELLYDLGLEQEVVGITKFCIHPPGWTKSKPIIGGTKNIQLEKIKELQPDLVIANKEENVKEQVEALAANCPVYVSDITNLDDAIHMINAIGTLTHKQEKAIALCNTIQHNFALLKPATPIRTAYCIWRNPYMSVGGDTFIHHILSLCGFQNIFESQTRYPIIDIPLLKEKACELLLLSSEPYPFRQKHIAALQKQLPHTKILLADGEMFSWYGSRLQHAPAYFTRLIESI